jgi:hypothetical protein
LRCIDQGLLIASNSFAQSFFLLCIIYIRRLPTSIRPSGHPAIRPSGYPQPTMPRSLFVRSFSKFSPDNRPQRFPTSHPHRLDCKSYAQRSCSRLFDPVCQNWISSTRVDTPYVRSDSFAINFPAP